MVLTVPMRNGNICSGVMFFNISFVLTVPMRNGNKEEQERLEKEAKGSYRTYEEWKRFEGVYDTIESDGFLPYL